MNIVICGSRNYNDYEFFSTSLDNILGEMSKDEITILSGHCKGVDLMAERYAEEHRITLEIYPAEWETYGRAAGPVRNKQMAENCEFVIAFWDGKSKGTECMITLSLKLGREVKVVDII